MEQPPLATVREQRDLFARAAQPLDDARHGTAAATDAEMPLVGVAISRRCRVRHENGKDDALMRLPDTAWLDDLAGHRLVRPVGLNVACLGPSPAIKPEYILQNR